MNRIFAAAVSMAVLGGAPAAAQTSGPAPPGPPLPSTSAAARIVLTAADAPKWQLSGQVGWLAGNKTPVAVAWDGWYDSVSAAGSLGYVWTPHLIVEGAVVASRVGRVQAQEPSASAGIPLRTGERRYRTTAVDVALAYQFLENAWFHPFVDAGLSVGREVEHVRLLPFRTFGAGAAAPVVAAVDDRRVSYSVHPFATIGFKWYVGERVFVRSSLRARTGTQRLADVTFANGIGIDF